MINFCYCRICHYLYISDSAVPASMGHAGRRPHGLSVLVPSNRRGEPVDRLLPLPRLHEPQVRRGGVQVPAQARHARDLDLSKHR